MWRADRTKRSDQSSYFFYIVLRQGSQDEIISMFKRLQYDAKELIKSCISLAYFMRGSIPYEEMLRRTHIEREMITEFINDRLEQESKRMHPVY